MPTAPSAPGPGHSCKRPELDHREPVPAQYATGSRRTGQLDGRIPHGVGDSASGADGYQSGDNGCYPLSVGHGTEGGVRTLKRGDQ